MQNSIDFGSKIHYDLKAVSDFLVLFAIGLQAINNDLFGNYNDIYQLAVN